MPTPCETLEAEAIKAAQQQEENRERERNEQRSRDRDAAYEQLKSVFLLLEKGTDGKLVMCGREWGVRSVSVSIVDGSARYALLSGDSGWFVDDMPSLGRWLLKEREMKERDKRSKKRLWWWF